MKRTLILPNCGVKLRSKEESSLILMERYQQLKLEGKERSREGKILQNIIKKIMADAEEQIEAK